MEIRINGKKYNCNTKAITPIRYRSLLGESFVNAASDIECDYKELLIKLVYISIWDFNIKYSKFQEECNSDKGFLYIAQFVKDEIFQFKKTEAQREYETNEEFDEFIILAQMGICGLPDRLLDELGMMQICEVIRYHVEIKNPVPKVEILKGKALKKELGITEEMEAQIEKALKEENHG